MPQRARRVQRRGAHQHGHKWRRRRRHVGSGPTGRHHTRGAHACMLCPAMAHRREQPRDAAGDRARGRHQTPVRAACAAPSGPTARAQKRRQAAVAGNPGTRARVMGGHQRHPARTSTRCRDSPATRARAAAMPPQTEPQWTMAKSGRMAAALCLICCSHWLNAQIYGPIHCAFFYSLLPPILPTTTRASSYEARS